MHPGPEPARRQRKEPAAAADIDEAQAVQVLAAQERAYEWGWSMHPHMWGIWGIWAVFMMLVMLVFWGAVIFGLIRAGRGLSMMQKAKSVPSPAMAVGVASDPTRRPAPSAPPPPPVATSHSEVARSIEVPPPPQSQWY